jgi:hypothetical protein
LGHHVAPPRSLFFLSLPAKEEKLKQIFWNPITFGPTNFKNCLFLKKDEIIEIYHVGSVFGEWANIKG